VSGQWRPELPYGPWLVFDVCGAVGCGAREELLFVCPVDAKALDPLCGVPRRWPLAGDRAAFMWNCGMGVVSVVDLHGDALC